MLVVLKGSEKMVSLFFFNISVVFFFPSDLNGGKETKKNLQKAQKIIFHRPENMGQYLRELWTNSKN